MGTSSSLSQSNDSECYDDVEVFAKAERSEVMQHVCAPRQPFFHEIQAEPVLLDGKRRELHYARVDPSTVILHVYDLNNKFKAANNILSFTARNIAVGGAFHVGIEAFGSEWWYGCAGVMCEPPRTLTEHVYRCSIILGQTTLIQWVTELHCMCQSWLGDDYDICTHNCCCFAAELAERLGVDALPPWVDRFSRMLQKGHENSIRALRVAGEVKDQLLSNGLRISEKLKISEKQKISEKLATSLDQKVAFALPKSQLIVEGQKVSLQSDVNTHKAPVCERDSNEQHPVEQPVFVSWSDDAPMLPSTSSCCDSQASGLSNECHPGEAHHACESGEEAMQMPEDHGFIVGASVEYYSVSHGGWIPARIVAFDSITCLFDLDCKPQVPYHKIRPLQDNVTPLVASEPMSSEIAWLPPGMQVEYESASSDGCWISASIIAYHPASGLYDLDCKLQVPRHKIRRVDQFPDGANIEYRSSSVEQWISAQVLSFDAASGLYELSCKPQASRRQIRWPVHARAAYYGA